MNTKLASLLALPAVGAVGILTTGCTSGPRLASSPPSPGLVAIVQAPELQQNILPPLPERYSSAFGPGLTYLAGGEDTAEELPRVAERLYERTPSGEVRYVGTQEVRRFPAVAWW